MSFLAENNIRGVAFDIDGTLYPLTETHKRVLRASLFHLPFALKYNRARQILRTSDSFLPLEPLSRESNGQRMCRLMYGKDDEYTVSKFLGKEKRIFTSRYPELFSNIKPYEGVGDVLSLLKEKGYPMAVLSDFPVAGRITSLGYDEYFPVQLSSEEIGRSKPCQTPFLLLSEKMDIPCENILYIGDSVTKDVEGSMTAGMKSVLISSKMEKSPALLTVRDWKELKEQLF